MAFWWPWPQFGLPKDLQNETQKRAKTQTWNSLILHLFTTLWPHSGALKMMIFQCFFGALFWDASWCPFGWFWLTFGAPFGDHFHHFLGTVFASIFRHPENIEKWSPPSSDSSPSQTLRVLPEMHRTPGQSQSFLEQKTWQLPASGRLLLRLLLRQDRYLLLRQYKSLLLRQNRCLLLRQNRRFFLVRLMSPAIYTVSEPSHDFYKFWMLLWRISTFVKSNIKHQWRPKSEVVRAPQFEL